jgi:hypothetical protein
LSQLEGLAASATPAAASAAATTATATASTSASAAACAAATASAEYSNHVLVGLTCLHVVRSQSQRRFHAKDFDHFFTPFTINFLLQSNKIYNIFLQSNSRLITENYYRNSFRLYDFCNNPYNIKDFDWLVIIIAIISFSDNDWNTTTIKKIYNTMDKKLFIIVFI